MLVEVKTAILDSGDFLPATEVARLAGFSSTNLSVQPKNWKRKREIFAIQHGRQDYLLKIFGDAKELLGLGLLV
jgi:hypothetical protein